MKKFTILIFASLLLVTGLLAQKAPIVGVVDVQRVLADFTEFQSAVEKVRGSVAPVEEEMQRMQTSIQAIVTEGREIETKASNPAASEEARAEAAADGTSCARRAQSLPPPAPPRARRRAPPAPPRRYPPQPLLTISKEEPPSPSRRSS